MPLFSSLNVMLDKYLHLIHLSEICVQFLKFIHLGYFKKISLHFNMKTEWIETYNNA